MATEIKTVQDKISLFKQSLSIRKDDFEALLPKNVDFDAFKQILITAVITNPTLLNADQQSLFMSIRKCAQDGLLPDGREGALVIFKTKRDNVYIDAVQYMPMVAGVLKKLRNSGDILSISAHVVYANDEFDYQLGDNDFIKHKPTLGIRGEAIAVYAIIKTKDGAVYREVLNKLEVERIRQFSKTEQAKKKYPNMNSIWDSHWGEMAKKTVIRRIAKILPMSSDVVEFFNRDNDNYIDIKPNLQSNTAELLNKQLEAQKLVEMVEDEANKEVLIEEQNIIAELSDNFNNDKFIKDIQNDGE